MKEALEPVFRCDYCNKHYLSKGAMTLHERMCNSNPKNEHKCFQYCKWLNKDGNGHTGETIFYCGNENSTFHFKDLYSYKLERFYFNKHRIAKMFRMPLKCKHYEIENGHETWKN